MFWFTMSYSPAYCAAQHGVLCLCAMVFCPFLIIIIRQINYNKKEGSQINIIAFGSQINEGYRNGIVFVLNRQNKWVINTLLTVLFICTGKYKTLVKISQTSLARFVIFDLGLVFPCTDKQNS